jgi:hypothetical protein
MRHSEIGKISPDPSFSERGTVKVAGKISAACKFPSSVISAFLTFPFEKGGYRGISAAVRCRISKRTSEDTTLG